MAENVLYCSNCGAQSTGEAGFCQKCGARLVSTSQVPSAQAGGYSTAAAPGYPAVPAMPAGYYGGFWIRFVAYIIDQLVIGAVALPLYFALIVPTLLPIIQQGQQGEEPSPDLIARLVAKGLLFGGIAIMGKWLYEALLTSSSWQATVGKRVLRLKVTDDFGNRISFARATGRYFAKILSEWIMFIGFIMIAFTDRKRGLHDMLCNTLVVRY
jgi:uncharacterized RDD family membrane protein YckC